MSKVCYGCDDCATKTRRSTICYLKTTNLGVKHQATIPLRSVHCFSVCVCVCVKVSPSIGFYQRSEGLLMTVILLPFFLGGITWKVSPVFLLYQVYCSTEIFHTLKSKRLLNRNSKEKVIYLSLSYEHFTKLEKPPCSGLLVLMLYK